MFTALYVTLFWYSAMTTIMLALPFLLPLLWLASAETIITVPFLDRGTNKEVLLQDFLCNSSYAMESNTVMLLSAKTVHNIDPGPYCVLANLTDVTLDSNSTERVVVRCSGSGTEISTRGFGFYNVSNLQLRNIQFENCGGIISEVALGFLNNTNPVYYGPSQQAVLLFNHCFDISIENVTVTDYTGYAMTGANVLGNSTLKFVNITNSRLQELDFSPFFNFSLNTSGYTGSGLLFFYLDTEFHIGSNGTFNFFTVSEANLISNVNFYPPVFKYRFELQEVTRNFGPIPVSGAGGLSMQFFQNNFDVHALVTNSVFANNSGTVAGGVQIVSLNTLNHAFVQFKDCIIDKNELFDDADSEMPIVVLEKFGAGIQLKYFFSLDQLEYLSTTSPSPITDHIQITDTTITGHRATAGAAMLVFCSAQNISDISISLKRIDFVDNDATDNGDCILASAEPSTIAMNNLNLYMEDVHAKGNGYRVDTTDSTTGASFDFVNFGHVTINGTSNHGVVFENEGNTVIRAFSTNVIISGSVTFRNNTAPFGAALNLQSSTRLFVMEPADIEFSNNHAFVSGGAIYSRSIGGDQCVIQFLGDRETPIFKPQDLNLLNITMTFSNNTAKSGSGISIFAAPLYNCSWYPESVVQIPTTSVQLDIPLETVYESSLFSFPGAIDGPLSQIRSDSIQICLCTSDYELHCSPTGITTSDELQVPTIETFPGRTFPLRMVAADAGGQPVFDAFISARVQNSNLNLAEELFDDRVGGDCREGNYTLTGAEEETANLQLNLPSTSSAVIIFIRVSECPIGFVLSRETGRCDCISIFRDRNFECDIQTGAIQRSEDRWIGQTTVNGTPIAALSTRCPLGYCLPTETRTVNISRDDALCTGNRTGEICGRCKEGFSQMFGTSECGQCSNFWLFTIILYAVAGILLVIILFALRLTVSTGTINGLIFYAQAVNVSGDLIFQETRLRFLSVFISLLNLDLGFPICFYHEMDLVAKTGLQFVFPVYLWVIVITIIVLSRYSSFIQKLTFHSSVQVLVTLMYLSYGKLARSIITIFVSTTLFTENDTRQVWFFDGSTSFFQGKHIVLGIIAVFMAAFFTVPYKVILTAAPWCIKYRKISYFKPLIDAHFGPYKDKWRVWFAARLWLTISLILLRSVVAASYPILTLALYVALTAIFVTAQAYVRPFKSKAINILDIFFMMNFLLLAGMTAYVIAGLSITSRDSSSRTLRITMTTCVVIFIGSAFTVFWGIIAYHIYQVASPTAKRMYRYYVQNTQKSNSVSSTEITIGGGLEASRAPRVTLTTDEDWCTSNYRLRESLLDDSSWEQVTAVTETST